MNKNIKNNKNDTKKKRIPSKIVFLGLTLLTVVLVFGVYFIVTFSSVSIKDNLKTAFKLDELPPIVEANAHASDGKLSNTSDKTYKYAYTDKTEGLRVALFSTSYNLPANGKAGSIKYYIGFNTTDQDLTINSCYVAVGEKWHDYCSSQSSVPSTAYSSKYVRTDIMTFYSSERSISIDANQEFPKRYVLGMNKVKSPNLYVYLTYTYKNKEKAYIVEFDYDMYFIQGYTQVNKLS